MKPAKGRLAASDVAGKPKLTNYQRIRKIEETLETIRPSLQRDYGDVTLIEVDGKKITEQFGNASSIQSFGSEVGKAIKQARMQVASSKPIQACAVL